MRKFRRYASPDFLAAKWEEWGEQWEQRKAQNPNAQFYWHEVERASVNQRLLPTLKAQTQDHCSFCDQYPVSPPGDDTIEHFKPKSVFPREAYFWGNLYYCCSYCQKQKRERYDPNLLRPDAEDYDFWRYFRCDYTNGTILINNRAPKHDQRRAQVTIDLYRLNEVHPIRRKDEIRLRATKLADEPLDSRPYRDFLEGPKDAVASGDKK